MSNVPHLKKSPMKMEVPPLQGELWSSSPTPQQPVDLEIVLWKCQVANTNKQTIKSETTASIEQTCSQRHRHQ